MNEEVKILKQLSNLNVLKIKCQKLYDENNNQFFAYTIYFTEYIKQRVKDKLNGIK